MGPRGRAWIPILLMLAALAFSRDLGQGRPAVGRRRRAVARRQRPFPTVAGGPRRPPEVDGLPAGAGRLERAAGPGSERPCSLHRDAAIHRGGSDSVRLGNTNTKSGISIAQRIDAEPQYRYVVRLRLKGDHVDEYHPKGVVVHVAASTQDDKRDAGFWSGVLRESGKSPAPPRRHLRLA